MARREHRTVMLTSITVQNFKSFGERQTVPLRPITALIGPNNSGKSNLVSLARFVRNVVEASFHEAMAAEGGEEFLVHRPEVSVPGSEERLAFGWTSDAGRYATGFTSWRLGWISAGEVLHHEQLGPAWSIGDDKTLRFAFDTGSFDIEAEGFSRLMSNIRALARSEDRAAVPFRDVVAPLIHAREVKLQIQALRQDAEVVPQPRLTSDGAGLAAVLGLWRGSDPDRAEQLHDFVRRSLPEIKHVFVKPSPEPAYQRLWVQQTDGQQFDAQHVSDGVLFFMALAMHAVAAEPGSVLFVEEPEQCIHPRRLGMIMELFREIVARRGCQVVVVTHSPVLLDELRDEPESIVLFRRGESGTVVRPLTEVPRLVDALRDAEPGEMLANGFFDEPF